MDQQQGTSGFSALLTLFIVALFIMGGAGFYVFQQVENKEKDNTLTTPTSDVLSFTNSVSPTIIPTSQKNEESSAKNEEKFDKSDLSVIIQNGSGEIGAASKVSEVIKEFGYHVIAVENADKFSYDDITLLVQEKYQKYLSLLKKDLETVYTISSFSATLDASASADAIVIVGRQ